MGREKAGPTPPTLLSPQCLLSLAVSPPAVLSVLTLFALLLCNPPPKGLQKSDFVGVSLWGWEGRTQEAAAARSE